MLQVLEGYDLASMGFGSEQYLHLFTEAKKLAFADRAVSTRTRPSRQRRWRS